MMPDLGQMWHTESGPDLVMMWPGPGQTWARHGPCLAGPWPHDATRIWARSGPDVTNIIRSRHGPNVARSGPGLGQMWQNECGPGLVLMWPTVARSGPVPADGALRDVGHALTDPGHMWPDMGPMICYQYVSKFARCCRMLSDLARIRARCAMLSGKAFQSLPDA